jgi:hypothetical protein
MELQGLKEKRSHVTHICPPKNEESQYIEDKESESSEHMTTQATKRKKSTEPRNPQSMKKAKTTPKKTSCATPKDAALKGKRSGLTLFTPEELILILKVYMEVSCNTMHGTDKKADNIWDNIVLHYHEEVQKYNSINEENIDYFVIELSRNAESLLNC